jgi:hypothetical protein
MGKAHAPYDSAFPHSVGLLGFVSGTLSPWCHTVTGPFGATLCDDSSSAITQFFTIEIETAVRHIASGYT